MQDEVRRTTETVSPGEKTGVERLLRIVALEIGILILLLVYLAFRPQPGRFQFVGIRSDEAVFYDTAAGMLISRVVSPTGGEAGSGQPGE
jgi:hypothetical protein